jgi:hypothetical protein
MWLAATAGRHRVRLMSTQQGLGPQIGVGVVFSDRGIEGTSHTVGFRSHTAAGLNAPTLSATQGGADGAGAAGWVQAQVAMVARPAFRLPKMMSTGTIYPSGGDFWSWPSTDDGEVTPLKTFKALGFNTVPDIVDYPGAGWQPLTRAKRRTPEWEGLKHRERSSHSALPFHVNVGILSIQTKMG